MDKRAGVVGVVAIMMVIVSCTPGIQQQSQGGTMPFTSVSASPSDSVPAPPSRAVLDRLRQPSADMIQTETKPPYGKQTGPVATGSIGSRSTDIAESKGLASGDRLNADYATVQNMYRAILLPRLVSQLDLARFDEQLAQNGPPAPGVRKSFALFAQQCAGIGLKYIFIRNNLYVERLDRTQIDEFLAHADDPGFTTDQQLNQIVTDTYPRIVRLLDKDGEFKTGFDLSGEFFYNDAIVVVMAYTATSADLDSQGRYTNDYLKREQYLVNVEPLLRSALEDHWPGHISLFVDYE